MSLDFRLYLEGCDTCGRGGDFVLDINITHNLAKMAREAGLYKPLWKPEENGYVYAKDIVLHLKEGLNKLTKDPEHYKQFNAENGWGLYKNFVPFVEECYRMCQKYPNAKVSSCT